MDIVASDVEGTLTTGATWRGVGRYHQASAQRWQYRLFLALHLPDLGLAKLGVRDVETFKARWIRDLSYLFADFDHHAMQQLCHAVVEEELWPLRREDVLEELQRYQQQGCRIVLASGVYQPLLEAFAAKMAEEGLQAEALGTLLEYHPQRQRYSGRLASVVSTGQTKLERLQAYLQQQEQPAVLRAALGDSLADIPMLEASREPVAVYPDDVLQAKAKSAGWRQLGHL